jgi:general secretion pathway protein J
MKILFRNTGFTLVEMLVASTIGAFLVLVAVGTLRTVSTSAKMVTTHIDSTAEVRFASNLIAKDLNNLYRDPNYARMKFVGSIEDSDDSTACDLTFYTIGRVKARSDQPEGDLYEVEYYLTRDEEQSVLLRRLWPYPDPNSQTEPGGILTTIAEDIDIFEVRYYDGSEWSNEWPEDMETVPQLVEVNIVGRPPDGASPAIETFIVNLKPVADMISAATTIAGQSATEQSTTTQQGTTAQQGGTQQGGSQ